MPIHCVIKLILESKGLLVANHGVGLASTGGTVGKHSCIEPVEDSFNERMSGLKIYLLKVFSTF